MTVNNGQPRDGRKVEEVREGKGYEANNLLDPQRFNDLFKDDEDD